MNRPEPEASEFQKFDNVMRKLQAPHGVEQAFRPAVKLIEKPALAAEVPGSDCRERKDAPSSMDTPQPSAPGVA
jgi:hypothetical protein